LALHHLTRRPKQSAQPMHSSPPLHPRRNRSQRQLRSAKPKVNPLRTRWRNTPIRNRYKSPDGTLVSGPARRPWKSC
jgi:hypothetical protein